MPRNSNEGYEYRMGIVKRFAMTQDEQTYCWSMLNDLQMAVTNRNSLECDTLVQQIEKRVNWLRSDKGQAWIATFFTDDE